MTAALNRPRFGEPEIADAFQQARVETERCRTAPAWCRTASARAPVRVECRRVDAAVPVRGTPDDVVAAGGPVGVDGVYRVVLEFKLSSG